MDERLDHADILKKAASAILLGDIDGAGALIESEYPFEPIEPKKRRSSADRLVRFAVRDGFIDRYSGKKLVNPGFLRTLSILLPETFPFTPHWSMKEAHIAYWELTPTLDHVDPIANGGKDDDVNIVTTSMLNNSLKSNWRLEDMQGWSLHEPGRIQDWDGLSSAFLKLAEEHPEVLENSTIKSYHRATRKHLPSSSQ
ncbi:hypothetical protein [Arabiibacter massiliensis]|uniref:hypothetical protein n=1 Tax=Arabiibacter massiliensis TaxID=1870985 RepID=UPI0009B9E249|nr:hypothetical protein [Arabiibacter massiliensis]